VEFEKRSRFLPFHLPLFSLVNSHPPCARSRLYCAVGKHSLLLCNVLCVEFERRCHFLPFPLPLFSLANSHPPCARSLRLCAVNDSSDVRFLTVDNGNDRKAAWQITGGNAIVLQVLHVLHVLRRHLSCCPRMRYLPLNTVRCFLCIQKSPLAWARGRHLLK